MSRLSGVQRTALIAGLVVILLLALAQWLARPGEPAVLPSAGNTTATRISSPASSPTPSARSGLPLCAGLPAEVTDAVAAVRNDGPYLRPRDDGGIFGNRERLLPAKPRGYYREYTVRTPGERFPGPRRLITGGQARLGTEPAEWYYTANHYESFCRLRP